MNILDVRMFKIEHSELNVEESNNPTPKWQILYSGHIVTDSLESDFYEQIIEVSAKRLASDKTISIDVHTYFKIKKEGDINTISEDAYWKYADLIQISVSHARAIFYTACKQKGISSLFLPVDPTDVYYDKMKNGYCKMWN